LGLAVAAVSKGALILNFIVSLGQLRRLNTVDCRS